MQTHTEQPATTIRPDAIYTDADLRICLGLTSAVLARARREGRLRHTRQGRSILHRGQWVLDWLESDAKGGESQ